MTKQLKPKNGRASPRLPPLASLMPGLRLIVGNILILAIALGLKSLLPDPFGLLAMLAAAVCLLIHWIWSGRSFRRQAVSGRHLVLNLVLAEVCPAIGALISFSLQRTDDGIPFIIGITLSILFAIWMPLIVLLSFVFQDSRSITTKPNKNL